MLNIRLYEDRDADILKKLYLAERRNRYFFLDQSAFSLNDFIRDMEGKKIYVIEYDSSVIGFTAVEEENNLVTDLFVLSRYRKSNIYNLVFEFLEEIYIPVVVKAYIKDILLLNQVQPLGYKSINELDDYFEEDYFYLGKEKLQDIVICF